MSDWFADRIGNNVDVDALIRRASIYFDLGEVLSQTTITLGFEDLNIKFTTGSGDFVAKVFARDQSEERSSRSGIVLGAVMDAGISHPRVYKNDSSQSIVYSDNETDLRLVCMDFIEGTTFYKTEPPTDEQLQIIINQSVMMHKLDIEPVHYKDEWSVTNIADMYARTKGLVPAEIMPLVDTAMEIYSRIPIKDLPVCFVHGDIIKSNVIASQSGDLYIIDFSCSNKYPRIQELAVIAANLMNGDGLSIQERVEKLIEMYNEAGGSLEEVEKQWSYNYAVGATAMEYLGCIAEQNELGEDNEEIRYWRELGLSGLKSINGMIEI